MSTSTRERGVGDILGPLFGVLLLGVALPQCLKPLLGWGLTLVFGTVLLFIGVVLVFMLISATAKQSGKSDSQPDATGSKVRSQVVRAPVPVADPILAQAGPVIWSPMSGAKSAYDETLAGERAPVNVWFLEFLRSLEWKRFEDLVAAYSRELGYEAKTTRIGADGGVDVVLSQKGETKPVMVIQCKAWNAYKVGIKAVRELFRRHGGRRRCERWIFHHGRVHHRSSCICGGKEPRLGGWARIPETYSGVSGRRGRAAAGDGPGGELFYAHLSELWDQDGKTNFREGAQRGRRVLGLQALPQVSTDIQDVRD